MALLIGGFAFNAGAQEKTTKNSIKTSQKSVKQEVKQTKQTKKDVKGEDWNKTLKEYEIAVDNCVSVYKKLQKDSGNKTLGNEFTQALKKAENLKSKLEKAKNQLDRTQVDRLNKANQKLQQVYAKG